MVADVTPPQQAEGSSVYSGQGFANQATQAGATGVAGRREGCLCCERGACWGGV